MNKPKQGHTLDSDKMQDFGPINEMAALAPYGTPLTPQGPVNTLMQIRSQYPFLPIIDFPHSIANVFLPTAGVAGDLTMPESTVLCRFRCQYNFWLAQLGEATLPSAIGTAQGADYGAFMNPDDMFFYIAGRRTLRVVSDTAGAHVQAYCWKIPQKLPQPIIG